MIYDVTSPTAHRVVKDLLKSLDFSTFSVSDKKAVTILKNWNGFYGKDEVGPVIYNRVIYEFQKNTFKDEMGKGYAQLENTPLIEKVLPVQAKREKSVWWDDVTTSEKIETKEDIITKSFKKAFSSLKYQLGENVEDWKWNRVASVEYEHPIGKAGGVLRSLFNVGPFRTRGGDQVINNQIYNIDSTGVYKITAGPSTRRIIDFSDVENSIAILPTGQSGNIFSKHYKDQAQKYVDGDFVKMKLKEEDINKVSKTKLVFLPKK